MSINIWFVCLCTPTLSDKYFTVLYLLGFPLYCYVIPFFCLLLQLFLWILFCVICILLLKLPFSFQFVWNIIFHPFSFSLCIFRSGVSFRHKKSLNSYRITNDPKLSRDSWDRTNLEILNSLISKYTKTYSIKTVLCCHKTDIEFNEAE